MEVLNFALLLKILTSHFLADYIFQPPSWSKKKDALGIKSGYFWLHTVIHAITLSVLLWDFSLWRVVMLVVAAHFVIDAGKGLFINSIKKKFSSSDKWVFLSDQFLHLLIIVVIWLFYTEQNQLFGKAVSGLFSEQKNWWLILGYLSLSIPSSVLIAKLTQKLKSKLTHDEGIDGAGKWIGILERFLIFTFIILNAYSFIGFLLVSKALFYFWTLKKASDQKKTEYIINITLLSFSLAIIAGVIYI